MDLDKLSQILPFLLLRADTGINPLFLMILSPLIGMLAKPAKYLWSQYTKKPSVFIHKRDMRVHASLMHYITTNAWHEINDVVTMSENFADNLNFGSIVSFNGFVDNLTRHWDGTRPITIGGITITRVEDEWSTRIDRSLTVEGGLMIVANQLHTLNDFVDKCIQDYQNWLDQKNEDTHVIYTFQDDGTAAKGECKRFRLSTPKPIQSTKSLENVFLADDIIARIKGPLDEFISPISIKKYTEMGWARKLGYILYGPPGTGKSSLAYAICRYVKKPIVIVKSTHIKHFIKISPTLENKVILFDDIDCFDDIDRQIKIPLTYKGKDDDDTDEKCTKSSSLKNTSFSELLSALDGYNSLHECIIIFTTNHYEKLDTALVRPGRIDHHVELRRTDPDAVRQMFALAFGSPLLAQVPDKDIRTDYTMAYISNSIVRANLKNPNHAVRLICAVN
jgi:hypothetical protein